MTEQQEASLYYDQLRQEVLDFVVGERSETIWSTGPLLDKSKSIVPQLVEINQRGFLTTTSQPGCFLDFTTSDGTRFEEQKSLIKGSKPETVIVEALKTCTRIQIRQRAYLRGML